MEPSARNRRIATVAIVAIAVFGAVLRWWVLRSPQGMLNADEAYTGLEAREILRGRPAIVMGGAVYTGVADAYVFAPVLALFGAHAVTLKLLSSIWWAAAAITLGTIAKPRLGWLGAVAATALMWLAPGPLLVLSTRAYIGYGIGMLAVAVTLAASRCELAAGGEPSRRRSALIGGAAGFAFYSHPMFLAVALPMVAVVALFRLRALRDWWMPAVGAALIVNLPFLAWNVRNDWVSLNQPSPWSEPWLDRFVRFFSGLLPRAFGLRRVSGEWLGPDAVAVAAYVVLMAVVVVGCVTLWRSGPTGILVVVPLVASWPVLALFANLSFVDDGRYAIVAWPLIVVALVEGFGSLGGRVNTSTPVSFALPVLLVTALTVPWLVSEARPIGADPDATSRRIIELLDEADVDLLLGNYWFTLPVEYLSDSRIATAVAGHPWGALFDWQPGIPWGVRLPVTQAEVTSSEIERRAYVFQSGDPFLSEEASLEVLPMPVSAYVRHDLPGARLYVPGEEDS
jgi:hypothetical protein